MRAHLLRSFIPILLTLLLLSCKTPEEPIKIMVITGGHDYNVEQFNQMFLSLGENISFQVEEFPGAFNMFLPENRDKYDVLVFYHMWQEISKEEAEVLSDCIKQGKPLVVLHHSICAFDDWPEYTNIIGGKYFHKTTSLNGKEYPPCSYIHDLSFIVNIVDSENPITLGVKDFEIFDETYKGVYVGDDVIPILTTLEPSSTPIIGWTKKYGNSNVVTLQSGHDVPTFINPNFRKLLSQSIYWVYSNQN